MKYVVLLCDGMGDLPIEELGGKTPMEAAITCGMNELAPKSEMGLCDTSNGIKPGSDIANMTILGYDPKIYHTGRSPLEAVSIGVEMGDNDLAFRCNLVTLSGEENYADKTMVDYSAGEITTDEARELIKTLQAEFNNDRMEFYAGISYRHCLLLHEHADAYKCTPPHDISGRKITDYLPDNAEILDLMKRSQAILKDHPVNVARRARGLNEANSIWLWGEGTKPHLDSFNTKYGLKKSTMITAVDLLKGIGTCAGMDVVEVEGATGNIDTNFIGKATAAIDAFRNGSELVYLHVEAPDECGHRGETDNKVCSISTIDNAILKPVAAYLNMNPPYKIMVLPDHYTPITARTHTPEPVPYMIFDSNKPVEGCEEFSEKNAASTGIMYRPGTKLMEHFIKD